MLRGMRRVLAAAFLALAVALVAAAGLGGGDDPPPAAPPPARDAGAARCGRPRRPRARARARGARGDARGGHGRRPGIGGLRRRAPAGGRLPRVLEPVPFPYFDERRPAARARRRARRCAR